MNILRPILVQKRFKFPNLMPKQYLETDVSRRRTLGVFNLHNITSDELAEIFDDYGRVFQCKVLLYEHREPTIEGLVTMDEEGAKRAYQQLNGRYIKGELIHIVMRAKETKVRWIEQKYRPLGDKPNSKKEWKALAVRYDKHMEEEDLKSKSKVRWTEQKYTPLGDKPNSKKESKALAERYDKHMKEEDLKLKSKSKSKVRWIERKYTPLGDKPNSKKQWKALAERYDKHMEEKDLKLKSKSKSNK